MRLNAPVPRTIDGTVSLETLRHIAREHPQARIANVVERLAAQVTADAMRSSMKPRYRVKAGQAQAPLLRLVK